MTSSDTDANSTGALSKGRSNALRFGKWAQVIAFAGICVAFVAYVNYSLERFDLSFRDYFGALAAVALICLIDTAVRAKFFQLVYGRVGLKLPTSEVLPLTFVSMGLNFIAPLKLGAIARAVYLKRTHGFGYGSFASTLLAANLLTFLGACVAATVGVMLLGAQGIGGNLPLYVLVVFAAAGGGILVLGIVAAKQRDSSKLGFLTPILRDLNQLIRSPALVAAAAVVAVVVIGLQSVALKIIASESGASSSFLGIFSVGAVQEATGLMAITPGAIGFQEATGTLMYQATSFSPEFLLFLLVMMRLGRAIGYAVSVPIAGRVLARRRRLKTARLKQ